MKVNIFDTFVERSPLILERANIFLEKIKPELLPVNRWTDDYYQRITPFMQGGKCIRGNLVLLGAEIAGVSINDALLDIAAALEIFQSSILIHDDIIDQDDQRRGLKTIHTQYSTLAKHELKSEASAHIGTSLAICAGDVGFNLTYALLAEADLPADVILALTKFWGIEFSKVGLAEMDDVYLAFTNTPANLERIMALYRFKTARYTFCTPLMSGLIATQAQPAFVAQIEQLADILGIIFQIKDDELGLFGDQLTLGKPVGSDIRENKKTIFHHYLMNLDNPAIVKKAKAIFGANEISEKNISYIQNLIVDHGIKDLVDQQITILVKKAQESIKQLQLNTTHTAYFEQLLRYNLNRKF